MHLISDSNIKHLCDKDAVVNCRVNGGFWLQYLECKVQGEYQITQLDKQ